MDGRHDRSGGCLGSTRVAVVLAVLAMAGTGVSLGRAAWGRRQQTEAYRVGAIGERGDAALLAPLTELGWVLLHDRQLPGARENVDHVAIGPPGIVVIESKNWSSDVVVTRDGLRRAGRDAHSTLDQVQRQVEAIRGVPGVDDAVPILPIICIRRAKLEHRGSRRSPARPHGIRVCRPSDLMRVVIDERSALDPEAIHRVAVALDGALRRS